MMSRRNVISICIVVVVIIILIIMLVSTKHNNERFNDINSGSGGTYNTTEQEEQKNDLQTSADIPYKETGQVNINSGNNLQDEKQKYIVRDIGEGIVIYKCVSGGNDDGDEIQEFFDYALINTDSLPYDMKEMLKNGIEFYGEKELYEFLQAYSS